MHVYIIRLGTSPPGGRGRYIIFAVAVVARMPSAKHARAQKKGGLTVAVSTQTHEYLPVQQTVPGTSERAQSRGSPSSTMKKKELRCSAPRALLCDLSAALFCSSGVKKNNIPPVSVCLPCALHVRTACCILVLKTADGWTMDVVTFDQSYLQQNKS